MENRFFNMNLAGGAMLDIGVYALSMHSKQPKRAMISCEKVFLQLSGIYRKHSWLQVKEIVRIRTLT